MARERSEINIDSATGARAAKPDKRSRKRMSIYYNEDGTPDLSALSEEQRAALGLKPDGSAKETIPPEPPPEIPPEMMRMALGVLCQIEAQFLASRWDLAVPQVLERIVPPPPMAQSIAEASAKVINKYSSVLGRWADEIMLGCLLLTWQAGAVSGVRAFAAEQARLKTEEKPVWKPDTTVPPPTDSVTETWPVSGGLEE